MHESYLKLVGNDALPVENRQHFFAYASRVMRSVIVDFARARLAEGRGFAFTLIILCGYVAGSLAKLAGAAPVAAPAPMFWLYLLNTASVAVNLSLQRYFRPQPRAAVAAVVAP